jgi:hypothetical protein
MQVGNVSGSSCRSMNATSTAELILETLRDFTSVSSDFYPELGSHYREAIEEWYLAQEQAIEEV